MAASLPFLLALTPQQPTPQLSHVGVLHGDGVGPQNSTKMSGGSEKKFQMTNLAMLNNFCFMKYALKSVPGLADVEVPHGVEVKARFPPSKAR